MTKSQHFNGKVAQKAIISKRDKVLIVRNHGESAWDLPGGRLHEGERPMDGILREIQEELGITPREVIPFYADVFTSRRSGDVHFVLVYIAEIEEGQEPQQQEELADIRWIKKQDLDSVSIFPQYHDALRRFFEQLT